MTTKNTLFTAAVCACFFTVSIAPNLAMAESKKLKKSQKTVAQLQKENDICHDTSAARLAYIRALNDQIMTLKNSNQQLASQLADQKAHIKDLSAISGTQAESIRNSTASIGEKDAYIRDLQAEISRKDSMSMALVNNLKNAIGNLDKKDINVKTDRGTIYIDISDKMLFKSGQYQVTDRAKEVLGKIATVLLAHPDIDFLVEGHTDNVPFHEGSLTDNWDLSTKRATSVIRILQNEYRMPAERMTAAGRGEYLPVADNNTTEGKALNRRTRIVILPQLYKFFQLVDNQKK